MIDDAAGKVMLLNNVYDPSNITVSTADELFHWNKPILAVVDITSRFCTLLAKADLRDYETWGIHLLDMQLQGSHPKQPSWMVLKDSQKVTKRYCLIPSFGMIISI